MSLVTDVQARIRRYIVGTVSADDLSDWLDVHAQLIQDMGDADLRRLTDLTFAMLEDVFQGHQPEEHVRRELASLVGHGASGGTDREAVVLSGPFELSGPQATGAIWTTDIVLTTTYVAGDAPEAQTYGSRDLLTSQSPARTQFAEA